MTGKQSALCTPEPWPASTSVPMENPAHQDKRRFLAKEAVQSARGKLPGAKIGAKQMRRPVFNRLSYSRALRAGELRAPCPHIHEFACELLQLADKRRFPGDSRFDQETQIRKRNRPDGRYRLGRARATRAGLRRCAAATVLLGIRGLLVTAVTQTQDGQTLVEVITDPAFEAARCCPRCGKAATRVKERPRTAPRDVFTGDRQVLLDWRKTRWHCGTPGLRAGNFHRMAARRQAPGPADLPAADLPGRGRRR